MPLPVAPDRVGDAVRGLRALGFRGANVTIPHKAAVIPHLDWLERDAALAEAVNTIVVEDDGTLRGYNTDIAGFMRALDEAVGARGGRPTRRPRWRRARPRSSSARAARRGRRRSPWRAAAPRSRS